MLRPLLSPTWYFLGKQEFIKFKMLRPTPIIQLFLAPKFIETKSD